MKKRATIKDVAREAGVSIATISYVINRKGNLSSDTVEKVNNAIRKLNYIPNMSARSLINRKSNLIGIVIPQTEPGKQLMFNNPFYSEFLSGVEYTARVNGYQVIITGTDMDRNYLEISVKRNLDGIIVLGAYADDFFTELKKASIPIVLVDSYFNDHYFHSIQINDRYGGYIATRYLLDKGHRNIALLTGKIKKDGVSKKRYMGYRDALKEYDAQFDQGRILEGIVDYDYGYSIADKIAARKDITAIFATADILAMGVVKRLKILGVGVPEQISVVGFDDIYITKFLDPGLTTVKQNIYLKGETAVRILMEHLDSNLTSKKEIILPVEIVERESVRSLE